MNNKILKKLISFMLAFLLLINLMPRSTYAQDNFIFIDGYKIEILEDSRQRTVAKLEVDGQTYIMTHNMFENNYTLEKQTNENNFLRRILGSSGTVKRYKVNVKTFNEGELAASVENINDKSDMLKIDETSDNIKAQAALIIATGAVAAALIKAILSVAAGVVILGVTHYAASQVIEKLKRNQKNVKYYAATRYKDNVYVSSAIKSKSVAANRLKSGGDVFAISSGYAYDACKSASPIKEVSKPQKHGSGSKYYKHYHPMLTAKKQSKAHCFFI